MTQTDREVSDSRSLSLRDRQKAAVMKELRQAGLELFDTKGFSATSVDDIARRAGVSRSTFFRHFGSKEAILANETEGNGALFIDILAARPAGEERMEALEHALVQFADAVQTDERRDEMLLLERIVESDASLSASREANSARWRHEIACVLASRAGRVEPDLEDTLAAAILGQITDHIGVLWRSDRYDSPIAETIRSHFETFRRLARA